MTAAGDRRDGERAVFVHTLLTPRSGIRGNLGKTEMQKILVVDDAAVNRELLREMLEDNYVIEMAENGQQALRKLLEFKEELAAVLLDLQMPEMDGFVLLKKLREELVTEHIPVILITSLSAVKDEEYGLMLGAVDYITKPFFCHRDVGKD